MVGCGAADSVGVTGAGVESGDALSELGCASVGSEKVGCGALALSGESGASESGGDSAGIVVDEVASGAMAVE